MTITNIIIVRMTYGPDLVTLMTTLPEATYPWKESLALRFDVSRGAGPIYVAEHFPGIPVTLVADGLERVL